VLLINIIAFIILMLFNKNLTGWLPSKRQGRIGKTLHLQHLSAECRLLLKTAKNLVEVNVLEDPTYHVADDKLA
jgi:hypothetical protein